MTSEMRRFSTSKNMSVYLQLTRCRTVRTCRTCRGQIKQGEKYVNVRITPAAQPRKICQACAKKLYPGALEAMQ
ncbi:hypothetical protein [uncultured Methanomethylovorans sp.]|uniref:hypothetical protein n=1 Tax=uncultured Methanomethylovorans sp. TaxID=183759 RepID=UPI002AA66B77|nr:hypothetical protein [uncultured Methanomethylovorans sp.]